MTTIHVRRLSGIWTVQYKTGTPTVDLFDFGKTIHPNKSVAVVLKPESEEFVFNYIDLFFITLMDNCYRWDQIYDDYAKQYFECVYQLSPLEITSFVKNFNGNNCGFYAIQSQTRIKII